MRFLPAIPATAAAALFVAGCSTNADLVSLEKAEPDGSAYAQALAKEYLAFARYEADEMKDWPDSVHFARKGLDAAAGAEPYPEHPADWNVDRRDAPRLISARRRLGAALSADSGTVLPDLTAKAQAAFDCWVEQREENWQLAHIEVCRSDFQQAMMAIERGLGTPQSVYFDHDSVTLSETARARLADLVERATALDVPLASVIGHADRSGAADYNLTLSLRRADSVRAALIEAGMAAERIALSAAGEARPRQPTADGVKEAANRRVELIFLGDDPDSHL